MDKVSMVFLALGVIMAVCGFYGLHSIQKIKSNRLNRMEELPPIYVITRMKMVRDQPFAEVKQYKIVKQYLEGK